MCRGKLQIKKSNSGECIILLNMLQWFLTLPRLKFNPLTLVYKNLHDLIPAQITNIIFCHFPPHSALAKAVLISLP